MATELAGPLPVHNMPLLGREDAVAGMDSHVDLSTLPNPSSRSMTPVPRDADVAANTASQELNDEVATLSTKLINAINYQTNLDDTLSQTRADLERANEQIRTLNVQIAGHLEMIGGDVWVRRKTVESEQGAMRAKVAGEKQLRLAAEQEKKKMELELESLTAALFEEANKMVVVAKEESRKEQEVVQRRNDLLKSQLDDTQGLLKSQSEQLVELKQVMEQMKAERDDQTAATTPSSPGFSKFETRADDAAMSDDASQTGIPEPASPSYPTSFTHLLQPVLRTDLGAYEDFSALCKTSRKSRSRPTSATALPGLAGLGLNQIVNSQSLPSNNSTSSISLVTSPSAQLSPRTPNSATSFGSTAGSQVPPIPALKETKFYKRALVEDIEPTMRLDLAPGLSWLARRSVLTSMSDGALVIEPVPAVGAISKLARAEYLACSLCGESRKDPEHLRWHRFRANENTSTTRYPLCKYCHTRVRSTCDFMGFLRIVKDGHWRADDEDSEKAAWEESVRLREQMFWSRIGGGVRPMVPHVPTGSYGEKSPRPSQDAAPLSSSVANLGEEGEEKEAEDFATPAEEPLEPKYVGLPVEGKSNDVVNEESKLTQLSSPGSKRSSMHTPPETPTRHRPTSLQIPA